MQNVINIQVAVRIRDPKTKYQSCIKVLPPLPNRNITSFDLVDPEGKKQAKSFNFDNVYNTSCDQLLLYQTCVQPLIEKSLNGFNCSIFCYGQTASGKTYTMQGLPNNYDGILFKTFNQISNYKKNCKNIHFIIKLSYMEIYQETLIDLLVEKSEINSELKIRTDPESLSGKDLFVQGLTEKCIASEEEFKKLLIFGGKRRTVGGTQMNEVSSRSHAILTIIIDQISFGEKEIDINSSFSSLPRKRSKINLIDLAGSERSDSTGATGQRMKEGCAINQSLSCLGNVINALTTKQQGTKHVPFRDSKLTYLLSDSLGGNSLTLMIACIHPSFVNFDETLSTLRFAERVKKVKNQAKINVDPKMLKILELEAEVKKLRSLLKNCTCSQYLNFENIKLQTADTSAIQNLENENKNFFEATTPATKKMDNNILLIQSGAPTAENNKSYLFKKIFGCIYYKKKEKKEVSDKIFP